MLGNWSPSRSCAPRSLHRQTPRSAREPPCLVNEMYSFVGIRLAHESRDSPLHPVIGRTNFNMLPPVLLISFCWLLYVCFRDVQSKKKRCRDGVTCVVNNNNTVGTPRTQSQGQSKDKSSLWEKENVVCKSKAQCRIDIKSFWYN